MSARSSAAREQLADKAVRARRDFIGFESRGPSGSNLTGDPNEASHFHLLVLALPFAEGFR